tara:strand:+ start:4988 stop:5188 length:201 start_codon:yes stop_codon:yes gene_type:complete
MFAQDPEDIRMVCELDERTCRALLFAVEFTLEKWAGQGELDQEQLIAMKPAIQGMVLEFNLLRKSA